MKQSQDNKSASNVNSKNDISKDIWDKAIAEAKGQLNYLKIREARLKLAIRSFEENKKAEKADALPA